MPAVARIGDRTYGFCLQHREQGGTILPIGPYALPPTPYPYHDVKVNGIDAAVEGLYVRADCGDYGFIVNGSNSVKVHSLRIARVGDAVVGPPFGGRYSGTIVLGSTNVNAGI